MAVIKANRNMAPQSSYITANIAIVCVYIHFMYPLEGAATAILQTVYDNFNLTIAPRYMIAIKCLHFIINRLMLPLGGKWCLGNSALTKSSAFYSPTLNSPWGML